MPSVIPRATLTAPVVLMLAFTTFVWPQSQGAVQQHYDLGGPCKDEAGVGALPQIWKAKESGDWDRVVELERLSVRGACSNEYRWLELVDSLLQTHRQSEALQALLYMDSRGFDLNPSVVGRGRMEVKNFMDTPLFRGSSLGAKFEQLERASDERRARYRDLLTKLPVSQRPPDNYIAKGVCPFECCQYGNWSVLADTDLVAAPGSKRVIDKAKQGSRVVGLTGEVHLKPEPVVVLADGDLPKGSIAFVLDYEGEGFGHVYTHGKIVSVFFGYEDYCFRLSESCWGETLLPSNERKPQVWWVKVKLANGITGWTDKADNFDGKDGCG